MRISEQYKELAAKLGDIAYKLQALKQQEALVIEQIKQLENLDNLLKAASNEKTQAKTSPS